LFEIGHFLSLFDLVNVLYYKRTSEVNVQMCNYKVGDLLLLETRFGKIQLYVVIEELFGCTIKVKNIATGRTDRLPPRWFTKL
tara:strand:- start:303 stop:551 length:249 start_codon:yes stop_codon:yes gene_type:complete